MAVIPLILTNTTYQNYVAVNTSSALWGWDVDRNPPFQIPALGFFFFFFLYYYPYFRLLNITKQRLHIYTSEVGNNKWQLFCFLFKPTNSQTLNRFLAILQQTNTVLLSTMPIVSLLHITPPRSPPFSPSLVPILFSHLPKKKEKRIERL
jgi:hypothetical protein